MGKRDHARRHIGHPPPSALHGACWRYYTQLHGGKLPPVDIITFGSPCQGLSAAGKRKGFSDPRSGLFTEAIRIISEMREATNGKYPTWAVWENVPGALSSNGGLDFRAVLEAFTEAEIPFPQSGRWTNAGMVRGGRADIAWCVYNAQYFGTAQRRRRIFLVADFGRERSGEILFIPKSLRGYFEAGGTPWQGPAAYAPRGADGAVPDGSEVNCLTPWDTQQSRIFTDDGASPTLAGADGGGGRNPAGLVFAAFSGGAGEKARSIGYSEKVSPTLKSGACGFNAPCLCEPQLARTLTARGDGSPNIDSGPNVVTVPAPDILCAATGQPNAEMLDNLSVTLTCQHEQPIICGAVGVHQNQSGDVNTADTAYTLATNGNATGRNAPLVAHPVMCAATAQANAEICEELCPTITEAAGKSGNNKPYIVHPDITGAGLSRPAGMASETDLCVAYYRRKDNEEPNGSGVNEGTSFTLPIVFESHGQDARYTGPHDIAPAVTSSYGMGGGNIPVTIEGVSLPAEAIPIQDKATRYSGGGDTRNDDGAGNGLGVGKSGDPAPTITSGDRHAVAAYCLQGNMIGREDHNGPRGNGVNGDVSFTLNTVDRLT